MTGLIYMNARYYDPTIGQFISPDTIVPDPDNVLDYNRYMYGYGNPVKYNDPSGHQATYVQGYDQWYGSMRGGSEGGGGAWGAFLALVVSFL